ncbi:hypothetical protein ACORG1_13370 [Mycobacterium sp. TJFP1]
MPLRDILGLDVGPHAPVTLQMLEELTGAFAEAGDGPYSVDEVLFCLALSVVRLQNELLDRDNQLDKLKANLLNLEARILEAGVPLAAE